MKWLKPSGLRNDRAAYSLYERVRDLAPVRDRVETRDVVVVTTPLVQQIIVGWTRRVCARRLDLRQGSLQDGVIVRHQAQTTVVVDSITPTRPCIRARNQGPPTTARGRTGSA